jgi:hypothetical protein
MLALRLGNDQESSNYWETVTAATKVPSLRLRFGRSKELHGVTR